MNRRAEAIWVESRSRWQINVQKDGKRKTFTSTIKGRKGKHDVENKADEWLASDTVDMRFSAAWEAYLADTKIRTGTANYIQQERYGRMYMLPILKNMKLALITPNQWQKVIDAAAEKGLAYRTCKNIKTTITTFLSYADANRWKFCTLKKNDVKIPNSTTPERKKQVLQPSNLKILSTTADLKTYNREGDAWYINAWRFLVATGVRRGEMTGLRWEDIYDNSFGIRRSINSTNEITNGKNKNARRTVPLSDVAKQILKAQRVQLMRNGIAACPWVFPTVDGDLSNPNAIYKQWAAYCSQHGFKTTLHELRHTFISISKNDMPIEMIKSIVGHSVSMDTIGVYGHDVDGEQERATEIMNTVFERLIK